jgi:hypothetical protein
LTADPKLSREGIQANLQSPPDGAANQPAAVETGPHKDRYRGLDLWLHRITVLMFVFLCAVVGVLLVILPWRPEWTDNGLFLVYPRLRAIMANGFVRGVCSGFGLLDIWVGFSEAVHYHEEKHS